jgi:homopolymeric O-antigen transport system ATP-binding protein
MVVPVISVENLSKRYLIGHRHEQSRNNHPVLRELFGRELRNVTRKAADIIRGRPVVQGDTVEEFWALKDVSFEVREGEVLGIIGRNGAGKSTLLKILSRITEPTAGRVTLRGRVASLLEVGTGFHPELTGRENIYLNGAILGMGRAEINKKFDEIVGFAEVEKFLDTPVKRYSSGMYVRLAFAVAAHLEPEILIVDEVLAVGDADFQKKCLGKMDEVSRRDGRTVLFVSHNLAAIAELAKRAVVLDRGGITLDSSVSDAVSAYLSKGNAAIYVSGPTECEGSPRIIRAEVRTSEPNGVHEFGEALEIQFWLHHDKPLRKACFAFVVVNQFGHPVTHAFAYYPDVLFGEAAGISQLTCHFPHLRLNVGEFYLRTWLSEPPGGEFYEILDGICHFQVTRSDRQLLWGWRPEVCAYYEDCRWTTSKLGNADHDSIMMNSSILDQESSSCDHLLNIK